MGMNSDLDRHMTFCETCLVAFALTWLNTVNYDKKLSEINGYNRNNQVVSRSIMLPGSTGSVQLFYVGKGIRMWDMLLKSSFSQQQRTNTNQPTHQPNQPSLIRNNFAPGFPHTHQMQYFSFVVRTFQHGNLTSTLFYESFAVPGSCHSAPTTNTMDSKPFVSHYNAALLETEWIKSCIKTQSCRIFKSQI